MADEKLMQLTELCVAFKEAAEARFEQDISLQHKVVAVLKEEDMQDMMNMAQELALGGLSAAFGGEVSDDFLKLNIKACEMTAEIALRVVSEDTLRADIPAELQTEEAVKALTEAGAPILARLAGPR